VDHQPERTSAVREGDRWADRDGDTWFVVSTEDGPRMVLSGLNGSLAQHQVARRTAEYVQSEYGPILLRWRSGREVLSRVELRSAQ